MAERLSDKIREYLATAQGRDINLKDVRIFLGIEPGSKEDQNMRTQMSSTFVVDKTVKPSGKNDGWYKVLLPVEPIKFSLDGDSEEGILDVRFPRSYIDDSIFEFQGSVELSEGDLILITGETNFGKSGIAHSFLGENLGLLKESDLMGSECTSSDGQISKKLRRRFKRMNWVKWEDENGKIRFNLWSVEHDYEDYIIPNHLTVIDWLTIPGEFYLIDTVMKKIKNSIGRGLAVIVTQKNKGAEFSEGGQRANRYADLVLKIDRFGQNESLLTIDKVKAAKGKSPTGRTFVFGFADYGANLIGIREVVKCLKCWGKGYIREGQNNKRCPSCKGLKYIDK